ncbi:hypothetical protein DGG96_03630 [Legionella qingyii]|uniref:Uncharacterized protein n=1 Tax=Legionella qingyii TaxID=2184757 RepID=A0A317U6I8_9GAMM|nr:hypothetical protein [Legionella qingyii]PWY57089.1 hypothetical protein DGG96_03630 [Legionella qingyii]
MDLLIMEQEKRRESWLVGQGLTLMLVVIIFALIVNYKNCKRLKEADLKERLQAFAADLVEV